MKEKTVSDLMSLDSSTIVDLIRIYYSWDKGDRASFYPAIGSSNKFGGGIIFQGVEYRPLPIEIDEVSEDTQGRFSRPKLTISNYGLIISKILRQKNDFKDARIVRIRTRLCSLDDANFDGGENPFGPADPNDIITEDTFVVNQKLSENKEEVQFELSYPYDVDDFDIPGRLILPRYCPFQYRGIGCNYYGPPVETENSQPFPVVPNTVMFSYKENTKEWSFNQNYAAGDIVYVPTPRDPFRTIYVCNTNHVSNEINQPSINKLFWSKDSCSKTYSACKKHFLDTKINYISGVSIENPLTIGKDASSLYTPYGGFPSVDAYSYGSSRT